MPTNTKTGKNKHAFTLVEMMVVAPIVVIVIGVFISVIVNMTGQVLRAKGANDLKLGINSALDMIKLDVGNSPNFLPSNSITPLTAEQGYDNNTSGFTNIHATRGDMLILKSYATTANPLNKDRKFVFLPSPNACGSALESQNTIMVTNIIYFVKALNGTNSLWRRTIMPSTYATAGCTTPWQLPSCSPGYSASFCKTSDIKLVEGVSVADFNVDYFTDDNQTDPIVNPTTQILLDTAASVQVTINATKTFAGQDISQNGTTFVSRIY